MIRLSYLAIGFIFVASMAQANDVYFGMGLGYDAVDFYKGLTITIANKGEIYDKKDNLSGTGFLGEALVGYHWNIKDYFLATELMGNLSSLKYHGYYTDAAANQTSVATFRINKSYCLSLLPGFNLVKGVDLYSRFGWIKGDFHYEEYKNNALGNNIGVTENQWLNGFIAGIGTMMPLKKNMALRFEYDHIAYQTYTNKSFPMPTGQLRTIKITPSSNQFQLAFIYNFL